jgi:acyl-coenzyme A synthetase/AMP-(fatty) acid ligase
MMTQAPAAFNLAKYVLRPDYHNPNAVALVTTDGSERREYRWSDIWEHVERLQAVVADAGVEAGERVLIRLPNDAAFAFAHLSLTALGIIAVPISPMLTADETAFVAMDCNASAILHDGSLPLPDHDNIEPVDVRDRVPRGNRGLSFARANARDPAYMVYTSGTTGEPKGVLHAHQSVWGRRPMQPGWTGIEEGDTVVHAGGLNWTYTMGIAVYDAWRYGAKSVIYTGEKDSTVWPDLIQREAADIFAAVPGVYRQMLKYGEDVGDKLSSLRHGLTAGEALSPALLKSFHEVVDRPLYEALGMSECSTYISTGPSIPQRVGSPGKPQPGRSVAILDPESREEPQLLQTGEVGLLAVHRSDPGLMLGYWKRPKENEEVYIGDWFVGGDLASIDEDGYVWFKGRANDLMNSFGYRVAPDEVEKALESHPDVHEVGVAEAQVREDISVICAYVAPANEAGQESDTLTQALQSHCKQQLAEYKRPREFRFLKRLPRTRSGKVQRRNLEQAWKQQTDAEEH